MPPGVGPFSVDAGGLCPVSLIGHHYAGIIGPAVPAHGVWIAVEARFQVLEIFSYVAYATLIRIGAESMPGLLQGCVVAPKIEAVLFSHKGKAVGGGVAGILEVQLAEFLGRGHIESPCVHVGDLPHGIVKDLASGMGGEEFVIGGDLHMADKGVLQLPYDCVGLVVLEGCPKADLPSFFPDAQVQAERFAPKCAVIYPDGISFLTYHRLFTQGRNLYLFLVRGIVV